MQQINKTSVHRQYVLFKNIHLGLSLVGLLVTVCTAWLLTAFRSSVSDIADGKSILGFSPEYIEFLMPILWTLIFVSPLLTLFSWTTAMALRAPEQETALELQNQNIARVAETQTQKLIADFYQDIASALQIVRVIENAREELPKVKKEILESGSLLAVTVSKELSPLKELLDALSYDCKHAQKIGTEQQAKILEFMKEFASINDKVHRALALHQTNEEALETLHLQIDQLKQKLVALSPPAEASNVITGEFPIAERPSA